MRLVQLTQEYKICPYYDVQKQIREEFDNYRKTLDEKVGSYVRNHPFVPQEQAWRDIKDKLDVVWFSHYK